MDTRITNALVVTMDEAVGTSGGVGIVDDGAVGIRDGKIAYVGPTADCPAASETIDAAGCMVLPGLLNAHTHMSQTLIRGAAQDVPEIEWMNAALGPIANAMTESDRIAGARLGAIEAIRTGATTICEYTKDVGQYVESVYLPLGVRTVATEMINEIPADRATNDPDTPYPFDREQGHKELAQAESVFETYEENPLVTPMYGPQALDMVSTDLLTEIEQRSSETGGRIHMHIAQGQREARQIAARYGTNETTVSVLQKHGLLSDRLIATHLHGATSDERATLADQSVRMIGCPSSIVAIDGIVPPLVEYRSHGGIAAIGTDQAPGPGGHNVLRELRTAALCSKAANTDPTALPAWEALKLVTIDAARVLGLEDHVGSLTVGKQADIITIDLTSVGIAPTVSRPFHTAIPNLVYGASGMDVRDVFVNGTALLRDHEFVTIDSEKVIADAIDRATAVFDRAEDAWRAADSSVVTAVTDGYL